MNDWLWWLYAVAAWLFAARFARKTKPPDENDWLLSVWPRPWLRYPLVTLTWVVRVGAVAAIVATIAFPEDVRQGTPNALAASAVVLVAVGFVLGKMASRPALVLTASGVWADGRSSSWQDLRAVELRGGYLILGLANRRRGEARIPRFHCHVDSDTVTEIMRLRERFASKSG